MIKYGSDKGQILYKTTKKNKVNELKSKNSKD